jgi:hypothetical protein
VVVVIPLLMAATADLELLSSATLAHNEQQAAQLHQAVATLFTHSHLAVLIQLNFLGD